MKSSKSESQAQKPSRGGRGQRKNVMDAMVRQRALEADPWTIEVQSTLVLCRGCKRWIKLDQRNDFYSGLWVKHRGLCKGIKIMNGEVLPRRSRKTKGGFTAAALKVAAAVGVRVRTPSSSSSPSSSGTAPDYADADSHPQALPAPTPAPQNRASSVVSSASNDRQRAPSVTSQISASSNPLSAASFYPPGAIPMYGMFPGYSYDPRAASAGATTPPQGYTWPGYAPYGFYVAYYPAPHAQAQEPTPGPLLVAQTEAREVEHGQENAAMGVDSGLDLEEEDDDDEVFAP
ncbi:hypothetical protein H0H87_007609, partial [Tephrocybe sp. NHM501043]